MTDLDIFWMIAFKKLTAKLVLIGKQQVYTIYEHISNIYESIRFQP